MYSFLSYMNTVISNDGQNSMKIDSLKKQFKKLLIIFKQG